jgi:hypothetical protein
MSRGRAGSHPPSSVARRTALAIAFTMCLCFPHVARADETVYACGYVPNQVFVARSIPGLEAQANCPGGALTIAADAGGIKHGQGAIWQAVAPAGLTIVAATIPPGALQSQFVNDGTAGDYGGDFYWNGGSSNITPGESSASFTGLNSQAFGFLLVCGKTTCNSPNLGYINVLGVQLAVHETSGPTLTSPTGLWQTSGWVRGSWPFSVWGNSPSGLCWLGAGLNGSLIGQTSSPRDVSLWHQCTAQPVSQPVDTSRFGQGKLPLTLAGTDAAGVPASLTKDVYIDNEQPMVALSGPSDAPETAGTQYITATAIAGPSGVRGIECSLDGGAGQWSVGTATRVAVSGVGDHVVSCFSENNALDASGNRGTSAVESFKVKIGVPTVSGISFSKLVDGLRCRRVLERVTVPSRWVTVRWHHHLIRVRTKRRTKLLSVVRCHARTTQRERTVLVTIRRNGHRVRVRRREKVRVILLPHTDHRMTRRVAHGHATTVSGWLGTYNGTALGGQAVQVLTALDDGQQRFTPTVSVTTAADGSWTVKLPGGPSRLIEAQYGGNPLAEGSLSGVAHEVVPAEVQLLSVTPPRIAWGGTVRLTGRLRGGYLPPGGALVRLRIGLGSSYTTYGVHEHVGGGGQFSTTYAFGAGDPATHRAFWFQVASLPMGNYPYAPASSRRISVLVGGHPATNQRR